MIVLEKLLLLSIVNGLVFTSSSPPDQKKLRGLPSDSQGWYAIRMGNKYFVDKTPHLKNFLQKNDHKLIILTRPRRFGKTVFLEMMRSFFEGEGKLFQGLSVEQDGNNFCFSNSRTTFTSRSEKWIKFPVIHINFTEIDHFLTMEKFLLSYKICCLQPIAMLYNIPFNSPHELTLSLIIKEIYRKTNMEVIILVDEYDSLIHEQLINKNYALAKELISFTETFLVNIKNCEPYIEMAFIVGVSRLPLSHLQSGANNFIDVAYNPELATAFGFTMEELENDMSDYLEEFATSNKVDIRYAKHNISNWYDGYNFNIEDLSDKFKVLNPISTIKCLRNKRVASYWTATSSMKLIVDELYNEYPALTKETFINDYPTTAETAFKKLNPDTCKVSLESLMLSYGYLTITSYNPHTDEIKLKYPNFEIINAVKSAVISYVPSRKCYLNDCEEERKKLYNAMHHGNIVQSIEILRKWAFQDFLPPSDSKVSANEITRRLQLVFEVSKIKYKERVEFKKDSEPTELGGDIDFLTLNLPINYAISIKRGLGGNALGAAIQLVKYTRENPKSFNNAMEAEKVNITKVFFLALSFGYVRGGNLRDWIAVHYTGSHNKIDLSTVEADSESLKKEFISEVMKE